MNTTTGIPALISRALKIGTLCLVFKRHKSGWCAHVPAHQDCNGAPTQISDVRLCDWGGGMTLKRLRFEVARRYHAQVYDDSDRCYVNLRWALRLPNWCGSYGAMYELALAMKRAKLI